MAFTYIDQVHIFHFLVLHSQVLILLPMLFFSFSLSWRSFSILLFFICHWAFFYSFSFTSFCILLDPLGSFSSLIFIAAVRPFFFHTISHFPVVFHSSLLLKSTTWSSFLANSTILATSSQCRLVMFLRFPCLLLRWWAQWQWFRPKWRYIMP